MTDIRERAAKCRKEKIDELKRIHLESVCWASRTNSCASKSDGCIRHVRIATSRKPRRHVLLKTDATIKHSMKQKQAKPSVLQRNGNFRSEVCSLQENARKRSAIVIRNPERESNCLIRKSVVQTGNDGLGLLPFSFGATFAGRRNEFIRLCCQ